MKAGAPYFAPSQGRYQVNVTYDDGHRKSMLYSRWIMQKHLGRELTSNETVDHINEDKTDDRIENLQLLTRAENASKSRRAKYGNQSEVELTCVYCGEKFMRSAAEERGKAKTRKSGPYCSYNCSVLGK